jgi:hypothetical protein
MDRDEFREEARKKSVETGISIASEGKPDVKDIFDRLIKN